MNEAARAAGEEDLALVLRLLTEHEVPYLLVGGYALAAHGYARATVDIDILIPATKEAGERVREALLMLPDHAARDIDPEWFAAGENVRVADQYVVDVMVNVNGQTFESLSAHAIEIKIAGVSAKTIDLDGLLLTKKTLREKDLADRLVLERAIEIVRNTPSGPDASGSSMKPGR